MAQISVMDLQVAKIYVIHLFAEVTASHNLNIINVSIEIKVGWTTG